MSTADFRRQAHRMIDWIADYWEQLEQLPVLSRVAPGDVKSLLPLHPPETGESGDETWDAIFNDLGRVMLPGITHWQSPSFFGYFPSNSTGPAVLGELLNAGLGIQGMLWATSPACTEVEERMMDWLVDALGLPQEWRTDSGLGGGVIQGTASEAALVALVAARTRARAQGWNGSDPLVVYVSTQSHSSIAKAAMVAGIATSVSDPVHISLVPVDRHLAMDAQALSAAMRADVAAGRWPLFVCATLGTTSTTAFDDCAAIADVCGTNPSPVWLHVDAAHAASACVCPEFRWMLRGVERADSFCFNPHKWLLTNFDCDCFWVRDRKGLIDALSVTPEYLRNAASESGAVTDLRDMQVPLGRRFRALKLWFVLRHYGLEGLRAHIRHHVRLAEVFEGLVRADTRFEVVAARRVNLVCFRLRGSGPDADAANKALLDAINASGEAFLTHTVVPHDGMPALVLRMAIGAVRTEESHVRRAWGLIQRLCKTTPPRDTLGS